jgi:hypothetical protein
MFWKSFLISFLLNNAPLSNKIKNRFKNRFSYKLNIDLDYIPDPEPNPIISQPPETPSYKDDVIILKYRDTAINKEYRGLDGRFPFNSTDYDNDIILNVTRNMHKLDLLRYLENPDHSNHNKISLIEQHVKDEIPSLPAPNIKMGGLFKDWDA